MEKADVTKRQWSGFSAEFLTCRPSSEAGRLQVAPTIWLNNVMFLLSAAHLPCTSARPSRPVASLPALSMTDRKASAHGDHNRNNSESMTRSSSVPRSSHVPLSAHHPSTSVSMMYFSESAVLCHIPDPFLRCSVSVSGRKGAYKLLSVRIRSRPRRCIMEASFPARNGRRRLYNPL